MTFLIFEVYVTGVKMLKNLMIYSKKQKYAETFYFNLVVFSSIFSLK